MTTKNINGRELVFVEVPEAKSYKVSGTGWLCYKTGAAWNVLSQLSETYEHHSIIGKASSLSEEQWEGIVQGRRRMKGEIVSGEPNEWDNYLNPFSSSDTAFERSATKSGLSLLSSLGMNPQTTLILIKEK